ncbi:hypothetical protein DFH06DRAFT_1148282 [Mycena polygramma]|nr:hypothetical protein DFH06DRAFT_1148282 [Mycena polygramma]
MSMSIGERTPKVPAASHGGSLAGQGAAGLENHIVVTIQEVHASGALNFATNSEAAERVRFIPFSWPKCGPEIVYQVRAFATIIRSTAWEIQAPSNTVKFPEIHFADPAFGGINPAGGRLTASKFRLSMLP